MRRHQQKNLPERHTAKHLENALDLPQEDKDTASLRSRQRRDDLNSSCGTIDICSSTLTSPSASTINIESSPSTLDASFSSPEKKSRVKDTEMMTLAPGLILSAKDYLCLGERQYVNDSMLEFYLRFMLRELVAKKMYNMTHILPTQFMVKLTTELADEIVSPEGVASAESIHSRVRNWTKGVNIFEKRFVVLPIHNKAFLHWYVVIICNLQQIGHPPMGKDPASSSPCLLIFDSLCTNSWTAELSEIIRMYLEMEYKCKTGKTLIFNKDELPEHYPLVLKQRNGYDCGVFVMEYVESFLKSPPNSYTFPMDLRSSFSISSILNKRRQVAFLIQRLKNLQTKYSHITLPNITFSKQSRKSSKAQNTSNVGVAEVAAQDTVVKEAAENVLINITCAAGPVQDSELDNKPTRFRNKRRHTVAGGSTKRCKKYMVVPRETVKNTLLEDWDSDSDEPPAKEQTLREMSKSSKEDTKFVASTHIQPIAVAASETESETESGDTLKYAA